MPRAHADRLLRIQTVLYDSDLAQLWRLLRGLGAAAKQAMHAGLVGEVEWALGDSAETPALGDADVKAMAEASDDSITRVEYQFFDANLGSSGGQNRLAENHPSDLLLVLNPDTYPSPTALVELIRAVDRPGVAVAEARQIPLEHPRYYDPSTGETGWASGYCMLVERPLFDELQGFDHEHFLLHCDDVDFSWRARLRGAKIVLAPYAVVFHDKRPRFGDAWPAPEAEIFHSALGRLMLATRWAKTDVLRDTSKLIEKEGCSTRREALAEYRRRASAGRVPSAIPNAHTVAEFVGGEYAPHRF